MKKIGFIGAYDKTDLIIYLAKILVSLDKKVLVVDSTITQKAKYVVPAISPTMKYITDFENIDVAVGFKNFNDIRGYIGIPEEQQLEYDIALIDVDSPEGFYGFELEKSNKNYFVTCFDNYSLKKGLEILSRLKETTSLTKILFSRDMTKEEDDYLNFLSQEFKIVWNEYKIYFPIENGDLSVIYENQRLSKIKLKKISVQYKDSLAYIAEEILENVSVGNIRKVIKLLEKGV